MPGDFIYCVLSIDLYCISHFRGIHTEDWSRRNLIYFCACLMLLHSWSATGVIRPAPIKDILLCSLGLVTASSLCRVRVVKRVLSCQRISFSCEFGMYCTEITVFANFVKIYLPSSADEAVYFHFRNFKTNRFYLHNCHLKSWIKP